MTDETCKNCGHKASEHSLYKRRFCKHAVLKISKKFSPNDAGKETKFEKTIGRCNCEEFR